MLMKQFDQLPKNVKKTIRYIKQDASLEQLVIIQKMLNQAVSLKLKEQQK